MLILLTYLYIYFSFLIPDPAFFRGSLHMENGYQEPLSTVSFSTRVVDKGIAGKSLLPGLSAVGSLMGRGKRGKRRPCCGLRPGCPALGWG